MPCSFESPWLCVNLPLLLWNNLVQAIFLIPITLILRGAFAGAWAEA
jgi:hypothetical protein